MKKTIKNLKIVLQIAGKYRNIYLISLITTVIQILIGVVLPLLTARQIVFLTDSIYQELILASLMVVGISLLNEFNEFVMSLLCRKFRIGTIKNLQMRLGEEILKITQSDVDKYGTGTFIERLTKDTDNMADMFTHGMGYISRVTMNIGIFAAIFLINKIVFVYYFLAAVTLTSLYAVKTRKLEKLNLIFRKQGDKVSNLIGELVKGEKELKMLSAKETFKKKLNIEILDKNNKNYKERSIERIFVWLINSFRDLLIFLLIIILIYLTKQNQLSAAIAVALFTYKTNIMTNFMDNISLLFDEIKDFNVSCSRVFTVLDENEFHKEKFNDKHIEKVEGNFEFKNVSFGYNKDYTVINNMSFKVNAGETVAFVGKSGVGKSTIFSLLGKLYEIKSGEILIDGININTLDEDSIRGNMTIISQNPYIFNMSIRDNFKLVKEEITDEEIIEALKMACIYEFVDSLPNKLDTIIGEGGNNLSGGQKQRIAIARALIQNTRIILFDEATSSLDNKTQKDIQLAIDNLKGKYTIMIIAHRLSTIINADKIFLIEDGKVTAQGTHMELLESNETYRSLYKSF